MGTLQTIYVAITALVALCGVYALVKEDCPGKAASLGIVLVPLILRVLQIK